MPTLEQRAETFLMNSTNPVAKQLVRELLVVLAESKIAEYPTGQKDHAALLAEAKQGLNRALTILRDLDAPLDVRVNMAHDVLSAALTSPPAERAPDCPTHGDPLVCLACEADEDARPEWRKPCLTRRYSSGSPMRELPWRGCRVELSNTDQWCANCAARTLHRCSGCGYRWDGPLTGAELCGDCWRKGQTAILTSPPAERAE